MAERRGSPPGVRRGGRKGGTKNRRSILTERILAVAAAHPTASARALQRALLADPALPGDTRRALAGGPIRTRIARPIRAAGAWAGRTRSVASGQKTRCSAEAGRGQRLEAFWIIVRDPTLSETERRKAAYQAAEILLPKVPSRSRWPRAIPDSFGFTIHLDIAREYRDAFVTLRTAVLSASQQKALLARMAAIRARCPSPCPSLYQVAHIRNDARRLSALIHKRNESVALTPYEDADEAHRRARFASYHHGAENAARARIDTLREKQRQLKWSRRRLSRRERAELRLLRLVYPPIPQEEPWESREWDDIYQHPFKDELPAADGNFYPAGSKLRPVDPVASDDDFEEFVDVPRFVVGDPDRPADINPTAPENPPAPEGTDRASTSKSHTAPI